MPRAPLLFAALTPLFVSACPTPVVIGDNPQDSATATTTASDPSPGTTAAATTFTSDPTGGPMNTTDIGEAPTTGGQSGWAKKGIPANQGADILFVIDNSGSSARAQTRLAQAIGTFVDALTERGVSFRIGVTTTDSGNPRCSTAETQPEFGALVRSSCLDRIALGEFTRDGVDVSQACTEVCALTDADLQMKPTATHLSDGVLAPRHWVEVIEGVSNLPDGVTPAEALRCFLPQGVAGCSFPSQLESMLLAVTKSNQADAPANHGFMRSSANLAVIIVSDKTDCSFVPDFQDIFEDNTIFWEDPQAPGPTNATCWNATAHCFGEAPDFSNCNAENKSAAGEVLVSDALAVLQPMSRYREFWEAVEDEKFEFEFVFPVMAAISGVPPGYDAQGVDLVFSESTDPAIQNAYGIGPGCEDGDHLAPPAIRERQFLWEELGSGPLPLYSVCDEDFGAALTAIAGRIADASPDTRCMPNCVADLDPLTPVTEPNCELDAVDVAVQTRLAVPVCEVVGGTWQLPPGATLCYGPLGDRGGATPELHDDMSAECSKEGYNLEFALVYAGGWPDGVTIEARCELGPKDPFCPGL